MPGKTLAEMLCSPMRCGLFPHDWDKWGVKEEINVLSGDGHKQKVGVVITQHRQCMNCGLIAYMTTTKKWSDMLRS